MSISSCFTTLQLGRTYYNNDHANLLFPKTAKMQALEIRNNKFLQRMAIKYLYICISTSMSLSIYLCMHVTYGL